MIKFLYTLFIGILLATVVGVGIAAFYEGPKAPEYPITEAGFKSVDGPTEAELQKEREFQAKSQEYQQQMTDYNRNVSLISLAFALLLLVTSLVFLKNLNMISDGILLGGVFTLLYSIGRSFGSGEQKFMFVIALVGLCIALLLGYLKFGKQISQKSKSS